MPKLTPEVLDELNRKAASFWLAANPYTASTACSAWYSQLLDYWYELLAAARAGLEDKARLDWLDQYPYRIAPLIEMGATVREAIDKARKDRS